MKVLNPVIDGCMFMDGEFDGCSEGILKSKADTFFLTLNSFDGFAETVKSVARIYQYTDEDPNVKVIRTYEDIENNSKNGVKSLVLTFQEPYPIGNSLENLRVFYELGARVVQLTYNKGNYIGSGCTEANGGGLTDFGKQLIKEMNKLGMLVDVSHSNEQTGRDAILASEKPIVFSHANVKAVTDNPRNKSDDLIKLLAENGGVMGLTPWGPLTWKEETKSQPSLDDYLDHVEHVVNLVGINHVGFGSDATLNDSPDTKGAMDQLTLYPEVAGSYYKTIGIGREFSSASGFKGAKDIANVIEGLQKRGYSEEDINKFLGGNFERVLKQVWK